MKYPWYWVAGAIALLLLIGLQLGCRPVELGVIQGSKTIRVDGEEIVVTRTVRGARDLPATSTPQASTGDAVVLDIGRTGDPGDPDPQRARTQNEIDLAENLFVGLTRFRHVTAEAEPYLAESWDVGDDGLVWTFHLRPDFLWVKPGFAEGSRRFGSPTALAVYRPVIADDVVFALQRACDPATRTPDALVLYIIEGCEALRGVQAGEDGTLDFSGLGVHAPDDHTVVIRLTEPASYLPVIMSLTLARPVPRELVTPFVASDDTWTFLENIVTSGPFTIGTETNSERQTVLRRNPFWPLPFSGAVDVVNLYWLADDDAYEKWTEQELDISPVPVRQREDILEDSRLWSRLMLASNQAVFYLAFNFDSPVFSDARVRRAFSAAIDRDFLIDEVYGSQGVAMRHFTPPGVFGAPPVDSVGVGYNIDRARLEMDESSLGHCSFLPPIRYMVGSTDLALFHAETVRTIWNRELGCPEENIIIEQVHFGELLSNTRPDAGSNRPDIWDLAWASYFPDAHNGLAEVLHCTMSENRQNRACSQADTLIAQAASTRDPEQRAALYREAERLFFGETGSQPVAPLFVQGRYLLVQPWLQFVPAHFGGEQFDTYRLDAVVKRLEREQ
ncbi:MAG: peptide ABC transporter substrate-binding protein [Anaerolineae bacterium]|nr:peptide ABC transporter substrate-binding protein [Anaerolineae bacterium]